MQNFFKQRETIEVLGKQVLQLRANQAALQQALQDERNKTRGIPLRLISGIDDTEVEPSDTKEREEYTAQVQLFYDNILDAKLRSSIARVRQQLAQVGGQGQYEMTREQFDHFLRGMEAMAWSLREWCETLSAERRAALQDKENEHGSI